MRTAAFITIIVCVFVISLGAVAAAQTVPTLPPIQPTFTFAPFVTRTPLPTFTAAPPPTTVPCAAPLGFQFGDTVALDPGVNLRHLPTLSGAVVNYYTEEVLLVIVDGPVCADGYNWWRVLGVGEPGWVVEGRPGRYFLTRAEERPDPSRICFPPLPLEPGTRARVVLNARVRNAAGLNGMVLTTVDAGTLVTVLREPECSSNQNWWLVRVPAVGGTSIEGYIAEGYPGEYVLETEIPPTPLAQCYRALRLAPGTRAAVIYSDRTARTLRSAPTVSAPAIQRMIAGVAFDIVDGPVCADGYNWWQVRIVSTDVVGWLAEGVPGNYWFDIITEVQAQG